MTDFMRQALHPERIPSLVFALAILKMFKGEAEVEGGEELVGLLLGEGRERMTK